MGLQGQLNDVSSDSIPLLLLALISASLRHIRSSFLSLLHSLRLHSPAASVSVPPYASASPDDGLLHSLGSGLAGLIILSEQLDRGLPSRAPRSSSSSSSGSCVVCLSELMDGGSMRALPCRHVFHKQCFDEWAGHLNFSCPICRSPLVPGERMEALWRRVGEDAVAWFCSLR